MTCILKDSTHRALKVRAAEQDTTLLELISKACEMYLHQASLNKRAHDEKESGENWFILNSSDRGYLFYLGFNDQSRYDIWFCRRTLHVHCGIIVIEFSVPSRGPSKTSRDGQQTELASPMLGDSKDKAPWSTSASCHCSPLCCVTQSLSQASNRGRSRTHDFILF